MENREKLLRKLLSAPTENGAFKANIVKADRIETDQSFRKSCEDNFCGMYGKCYMCPPDVGNIIELMAELKKYDYALVYQTVTALEDSYDFEGMMEAKKNSRHITDKLRKFFVDGRITKVLYLGPGGCGVCERCAKETGEPCRFPKFALPSLEAYGINVSSLAKTAGMKYTNGENTVTYFGAVLFSLSGEKNEGAN